MYSKKFLFAAAIVWCSTAYSQDKKTKVITTSFEVGGVCGMCEERIEKAVDVKGVKAADYMLETKQLKITYSTKHISEEKIHALLNEAGHDTDFSRASDKEYDSLHHCCKYRGHED